MSVEEFKEALGGDVVIPSEDMGLAVYQYRVELFAWKERARMLENALRQAREAFRLTREYVGADVLPEASGWAWFDAVEEIDIVLGTHG